VDSVEEKIATCSSGCHGRLPYKFTSASFLSYDWQIFPAMASTTAGETHPQRLLFFAQVKTINAYQVTATVTGGPCFFSNNLKGQLIGALF
jgi:hypothetical protein